MKNLFILLILFSTIVFTQKKSGTKFINSGLNYSPATTTKIAPVFGLYLIDKKSNINNFQLNRFHFNRNSANRYFQLDASYHKIIGVNKKSDSKFYFGIGFGGSIYYNYWDTRATSSNTFNISNAAVGIIPSIKPVINYSFNEKIYLGLSANIQMIDWGVEFSNYENPSIPKNQQKITVLQTTISSLPQLGFDLTVGFKIN